MPRALCLLTTLAALALPAAAQAGVPYVLGNVSNGAKPTATAGPDGVTHVVWNDPASNTFHYCQILKGKQGCAKSTVLAFNDTDGSSTGAPGKAWILRNPVTGVLYLAHAQYVSGDAYVWTSTDNGTSFTGPVKVFGGANGTVGTDSERPLLRTAGASVAFPTWNPGPFVLDVPLSGAAAGQEAKAALDEGGHNGLVYNLSLAAVPGATVATADDLDAIYAWSAPDGSPLSAAPSWGAPSLVTAGQDSTMNGAAGQAFLGYTTGSPDRFEIRKWGGMAFGAPTVIQKTTGYLADLDVADNGNPGAVYRQNGTGLRYTFSADGGKHYVTKTIARSDEVFFDLILANDTKGSGVAVWTRDGAVVAADLTEVADPSIPAVSTTVTKKGRTLGLNVPGSCVLPGKSYKVTTGGQGQGKLKKVTYRFGAQKKTDTHKPWSATFKVPKSATAGATIPVSALHVVAAKPKSFTITISSSVRVCGG